MDGEWMDEQMKRQMGELGESLALASKINLNYEERLI